VDFKFGLDALEKQTSTCRPQSQFGCVEKSFGPCQGLKSSPLTTQHSWPRHFKGLCSAVGRNKSRVLTGWSAQKWGQPIGNRCLRRSAFTCM